MQASWEKSDDFRRKTQTCNAMFANRGVNQSKITYDYNEYIKSTINDYYQLLRWAIFYSQIEQIKQIAMDYLCSRIKRIKRMR